jgi:hypothetical protein
MHSDQVAFNKTSSLWKKTAVLSLPRNDSSSSDPLSLFNNRIIHIMHDTDEQCVITQVPAVTPEQLVADIILSDELPTMRQHLREMAEAFLLTDEDAETRHRVYGTYANLDRFLARTEVYVKLCERRTS